MPSLPSGWVLDRYLGDGWLPSSETGGCRLRPVAGSWSGISETGGCHLRRRVVAVSPKSLGAGQVSRRRVVAVFGDGWLPSPPSGWELSGISETGGCRLEIRTGTREKAVVRPVSFSSSRNETWGKLPGSPARLCARFLALVSWCPGCVGGLGMWPSVPVLCVGLVPSCAPGLVALSGFVHRVCFKKEVTTQGTDPKTGFSDHGGRNKGPRPEDRSFNRYTLLRMGSIRLVRYDSGTGYVLWSLSWPLLSSSSPLSLVCSNPPAGVGGRTSTCRAGSPWRLFVFLIIFSWCSRSSSQVVLWDCSCCRR